MSMEDLSIRQLLAARHIRPRRALGQCFMADKNFVLAVARSVQAAPQSLILEVGPGTGVLTRALLGLYPQARVLAIEIAPDLVELLRENFTAELATGRLILLEGDVLQSKHRLNPRWVDEVMRIAGEEPWRPRVLAANLPYSIATPLIALWATGLHKGSAGGEEPLVERMVATVQMELARRLMGRPAGPDYGPLAAFLDLRARVTLLRKAGPAIFWPRPKVDSALIEIALKPPGQTPFPLAQSQAFLQFLNRAFRTRRKKIRNIIGLPGGRAAPQGDRRPGELEPRELLDLYRLSTVPLPTSAQGMPSSRSFRLEK